MANDNQFKLRTRFVATRGVHDYRATIPALVAGGDTVLELGCAWGTTTAVLARHCRLVVGTDISPECIARARRTYPDLRFEVLDAFDVRAALELGRRGPPFTKVYADLSGLSGYRSLLDAIALLTMYATVLRPDTVVVKSGALRHFASLCTPWPGQPRHGESQRSQGDSVAVPPGRRDTDGRIDAEVVVGKDTYLRVT